MTAATWWSPRRAARTSRPPGTSICRRTPRSRCRCATTASGRGPAPPPRRRSRGSGAQWWAIGPTTTPTSAIRSARSRSSSSSARTAEPPTLPQLLADQPAHLAAVRAALGLLHHRADDHPGRLRVAGAHLLGGLRIGLDRGGDDRLELAAVRDLSEALALDQLLGVAAL